MARQVDVRGAGLGDPRGDRPDPATRDELDPDPGGRVDRARVGDQLGKVLDRVDVVMGRWADVALAGLAATQRGDVRGRLAPGELPALTPLGSLGDLDLELVGPGEIRGGHAESCRCHLLDPGVVAAAVWARDVPSWVRASLPGRGRPAGALDADGQRLVSLWAERADAHRRDDEPA